MSYETLEAAVQTLVSTNSALVTAVTGTQQEATSAIAKAEQSAIKAKDSEFYSGQLLTQTESHADRAQAKAIESESSAVRSKASEVASAASAATAAAVVTGGTAALSPEPGKIPLADGEGKIDPYWIGTPGLTISGLQSIYAGSEYKYKIEDFDQDLDYVVQVTAGDISISGDTVYLSAPQIAGNIAMTIYAGDRSHQMVLEVKMPDFIPTPAATPENFGDPLDGGFYAGMFWNRIALSGDVKAIELGDAAFTVDQPGALVYVGQMIEVRSVSNPFNKLIGTVTGAASGRITLDVTSTEGSGTHSDWAIMARFRSIVSPKSQGESPTTLALKFENTALPLACQTLTEGWESTNAMFNAGTAAEYPAAHFARSLDIGGYTDWYIPSRDELELSWRNLKPMVIDNYETGGNRLFSSINYKKDGAYTDVASVGRGVNLNSYPQGAKYTPDNPDQTLSTAFQSGGAEQFVWNNYFWSSSEYSATYAWYQFWVASSPGTQSYVNKSLLSRVRAVRRSII